MRNVARFPENDRRDLFRAAAQKMRFYRCPWAMYDTAKPRSLKLLPPEHHVAELKKDYQAMQAMLFGQIPSFEEIMKELGSLEKTINALGK